jgi:hypothetical protein
MPNWVYNYANVSGKREDLLAFAEKARQPHETLWITSEWQFDEKLGKNVKVPDSERKIEPQVETPNAISFWNFIRPADKDLPLYFGHIKTEKPEGYEDWDFAQKMDYDLRFTGSDWYDWNVREWGTKWDAGQDELENDLDKLEANDTLVYRYETAWSIPEPVMRAMVEQHPELTFHFECEEEQGWGAEFEGNDGELSTTKEWDIPSSHADYVERGNEDSCSCQHNEEEEYWYDDCPDKQKDFEVVVRQVYRVRATDEDTAKKLLTDNLTPAVFQSPDPEKAHFAEETISARLVEDTDELIDLDA